MKKIVHSLACLAMLGSAHGAFAAYQDVVLAGNPIAYYRFEETTGTTASDSSGSGNDGTYMNGVTLGETGIAGAAAGFDGVNDYVNTPNTVGMDFTLEAWINTTANSPGGVHAWEGDGLLWSDVGGSADDFVVGILDNRLAFTYGDSLTLNDTTVTGGPELNDGEWHHIAVTRDMGVGVALYVDGNLVAAGPANNQILDDNPEIHIGGNTLDSRYFQGLIDEVAYYDRVLTVYELRDRGDAVIAEIPALSPPGMFVLATVIAGLAFAVLARGSASA